MSSCVCQGQVTEMWAEVSAVGGAEAVAGQGAAATTMAEVMYSC